MNIRIENFVSTFFGEGKLSSFRESFPMAVAILGHEDTEEEKQEEYASDLRIMRNNLIAYKEELQLKLSSEKRQNPLIELKVKLEKEKLKQKEGLWFLKRNFGEHQLK